MSWIVDSSLTYFQKLCLNVVKSGRVPRHVAIIMDGNRRFAQKINRKRVVGHELGFEKLAETLQWCLELGIKEVTVYAFSIENFKRSKEEVDALINLSREKYKKLLEEKDRLMKEGICIRVLGNLELLPPDIRKMIAEAMLMTKDNNKAYLNVAFAYTSRDEITNSIKEILDGIKDDYELRLKADDIDEDLIEKCLYTKSNPDMLIRTSGEVRFSDFLLWQIKDCHIYFAQVLWPEFNIWNLLGCIIKYQIDFNYHSSKKQAHKLYQCRPQDDEKSRRVENFLKQLELKRWSTLEGYAQC